MRLAARADDLAPGDCFLDGANRIALFAHPEDFPLLFPGNLVKRQPGRIGLAAVLAAFVREIVPDKALGVFPVEAEAFPRLLPVFFLMKFIPGGGVSALTPCADARSGLLLPVSPGKLIFVSPFIAPFALCHFLSFPFNLSCG